ncbi:hypothetical protein BC833DRAFT_565961 [Globomyces pollinis-pini]|nr:hypothetical protein BC833DRAFT_565961 [Globomyces pollinis-pini]
MTLNDVEMIAVPSSTKDKNQKMNEIATSIFPELATGLSDLFNMTTEQNITPQQFRSKLDEQQQSLSVHLEGLLSSIKELRNINVSVEHLSKIEQEYSKQVSVKRSFLFFFLIPFPQMSTLVLSLFLFLVYLEVKPCLYCASVTIVLFCCSYFLYGNTITGSRNYIDMNTDFLLIPRARFMVTRVNTHFKGLSLIYISLYQYTIMLL